MAGSLEIYLARIPAVSLSPALLPAADSASDPNSALFGIIREQEAVWIIVSAFASRRIITENLIDTSESEKFLPGKPLTRPRHHKNTYYDTIYGSCIKTCMNAHFYA